MITTSKQHPEDPIDTIVYSDAIDFNTIGEDLYCVIKKFDKDYPRDNPRRTFLNFLLTVNAKQGNISISGYDTEEADFDKRKWSILFELPILLKASQNQASENDATGTQYFEEVVRKALTELVDWCLAWYEDETSKGIEYQYYDEYIIFYTFDSTSKPEQFFSSVYDDD